MCSWSPETCCSQRLQLCDVWKRGAAFPAAWCTAAAKVTVGQFCHVDNFAPPGSHRQRSHTWPYCAVSENSGRRSRLAGLPIFSNFWAEKFYTDFSVSSGSLLHQTRNVLRVLFGVECGRSGVISVLCRLHDTDNHNEISAAAMMCWIHININLITCSVKIRNKKNPLGRLWVRGTIQKKV